MIMLSDDMAKRLIREFGSQTRYGGPEERYADIDRRDHGCLWWNDLYMPSEREYAESKPDSEPLLSYLDFTSIARDDSDSCGQASTVYRSNLRSLKEAYPNVFTPLHYVGSECLGAFLVDLDDGLAEVLLGLAHDYPAFDDTDMSLLESEDIEQSWESWARSHMYGEVNERTQDDWLAIGDARVDGLLWSLVHAAQEGRVPSIGYGGGWEGVQHDGLEISWDFKGLLAPLSSAIQRTAHKLRKRGLVAS